MPNRLPNDEEAAAAAAAAGVRPVHHGYDALWERVDNQGRAIRALSEETASQFRDFRAETTRTFSDITASIKAIDTKLDASTRAAVEHGRPQYAALIMGMLAAIGVAVSVIQWQNGLRDKPVDDKLLALATATTDLTKTMANGFAEVGKNYVSEKEFAQIVDFQNRISDQKSSTLSKSLERLQAQLDKVENVEVSRAEHTFHWDGQQSENSWLQSEISTLSGRLDQLSPAGDALKQLTARQHELEMRVFGGSK